MDLKTYFRQTKRSDREEFAKALGVNHDYLYHCSRGSRRPSSKLCQLIVKLDARFTLAELRPDIWGGVIENVAASDDVQPPVGGPPIDVASTESSPHGTITIHYTKED
jgi:DNA-binding XRE family transcriptional regulator